MSDKVIVTEEALMAIAAKSIKKVIEKNKDYGDAWQRYGQFTGLIRMNDKLLRVETLSDGRKALVAQEGINDTIFDLFGYSMLLMLRAEWEAENCKTVESADDVVFPEVKCQQLPLFNAEIILKALSDE
jgi:hypothetical protein